MNYLLKIIQFLWKFIVSIKVLISDLFSFLLVILRLFKNSFIFKLQNLVNLDSISKNIKIDFESQKQNLCYNYKDYTTSNNMFETWLDKFYNKIKIPNLITSSLIGITVYLLGLIFSFSFGFQNNYLNSIPIYIGVGGIILTIFTIRYGSISIHKSYIQIRPCFFISDEQYKTFLHTWYSRLSNNRKTFLFTIIFIIFLLLLVYIRFYHFSFVENFHITSLNVGLFLENGWFDNQNKIQKILLLGIFAIAVAFPLITASRILLINFFFLLDLRHIPIIPIPNLIRTRLREVTSLYILITFLWFVGVSLFGIIFFNNIDIVSTLLISVFSILGILTFLTPQIIYHKLLTRSELTASKWILASFYKKLDISLMEEFDDKFINPISASQKFNLETLVDYFDASVPVKRWVYSPSQIFTFIIGQIFTLLSPELFNVINLISK